MNWNAISAIKESMGAIGEESANTVKSHWRRVRLDMVATLTVILIGASAGVAAQDRTLEIDDLRLEVDIDYYLVLSPDGSQTIITTSTPNYEDNRFDRTLILVDVASGEHRDLTPSLR